MLLGILNHAVRSARRLVVRRVRWHARVSRELIRADRARRSAEALEARLLLSGYGFDFPGEVAPRYAVTGSVAGMTVAELNGDGRSDVAVSADYAVVVMLNSGDGAFATRADYFLEKPAGALAAADVNGDGDLDLIAAQPNGDCVSILRNNGDGTFDEEVNYPTGDGPAYLAVADVDGDGKLDLIAGCTNVGRLSVLRNNGDGTFAPKVDYLVGSHTNGIAAADLNGDGKAELVAVNGYSDDVVSVLRNNGDGTFAARVTYPVDLDPRSVTAADIDGDGMVDLVTGNSGLYPNYFGTISVLRNNGNGTFAARATYATGRNTICVAAADIDDDSKIDVLAANTTSPGTVSVLRNLGAGTFSYAPDLDMGVNPATLQFADMDGDTLPDLVALGWNGHYGSTVTVRRSLGNGNFDPVSSTHALLGEAWSVTSADFDGDGISDLACTAATSDTGMVAVLHNNGDGTLSRPVNYTLGTRPRSVTSADVNADGKIDLIAVCGFAAGTASVLLNNGDGTFGPRLDYPVGDSAASVAAADFSGDGKPDLVIANLVAAGTVSVLLNNGDGTFGPRVVYGVGASPSSVAAADLNGDAKSDLIAANKNSGTVSVLLNNGDGTFAAKVDYSVGNAPVFVAAVDLSHDGRPDLTTANSGSDTVSVLRNNGDGTFAAQVVYAVGVYPRWVAAADIDSDSGVDLITANGGTANFSTLSVLLNNGDGTFAPQASYAAPLGMLYAAAAVDVSSDGAPDLITAHATSSGAISVVLNDGHGAFRTPRTYAVASGPLAITTADFDGDGQLDMATAHDSGTVSVLRNLGGGAFAAYISHAVGTQPSWVTAADFNGDGKADLATSNFWSGTASVLLNNGNGSFAPHVSYSVAARPQSLVAADVNRDGNVDLVAACYGEVPSSRVSVLLNKGDGTFAAKVDYPVGRLVYAVAAADFNGDGAVDLVTANTGNVVPGVPGTVSVLLNNGDGTYAPHVMYAVAIGPVAVIAADLDGDGKADIATSCIDSPGTVSVLRNRGDGTFDPRVDYAGGVYPFSLAAADVSGDGKLDLVTGNRYLGEDYDDAISVLRNNGDGTFATPVTYSSEGDIYGLTTADVDADGKTDVLAAIYDAKAVAFFRNLGPSRGDATGDGVIDADDYFRIDVAFLNQLTGWTNGDFNGDNRIDIDDYFLIDTAYARQPGALAASPAPRAPDLFGDSPIDQDVFSDE